MRRFVAKLWGSPLRMGLAIAMTMIVLDQLTKWLVLERLMVPPRVVEVTSFFNLVIGWNRGVTFGLFNNDSPVNAWLLPLIAAIICTAVMVWMARTPRMLVGLSLGLIVGGAIGNVIDRLRFGAVFDFLDIHVAGYHWPAFNIADSAITIGAAIMIADSLLGGTERNRAPVTVRQEDRNP